jgi:Spy/CpxP family protein refolding chaperone
VKMAAKLTNFRVNGFCQGLLRPARLLSLVACLWVLPLGVWAKDIHWASLNLTAQQESHINQLESQWQHTHSEVAAQIYRDREELRMLLPTGDIQRIRLLQNRMMTNKMFLMNESMNTFLQKRDTLTPDQRAQLQRMLPNVP